MADDASEGVVNHKGQVFSGRTGTDMHEGLYGLWPADKAHHNPGHSGTWTKLNPDTTGDQGS